MFHCYLTFAYFFAQADFASFGDGPADLPTLFAIARKSAELLARWYCLSLAPQSDLCLTSSQEMEALGQLKEIDLSSNCFSVFPRAILLSNLQTLTISDNLLKSLPPEMSRYDHAMELPNFSLTMLATGCNR